MTTMELAMEIWEKHTTSTVKTGAGFIEDVTALLEADRQAVLDEAAERAAAWYIGVIGPCPGKIWTEAAEALRAAIKGETK